MAGQIIDRGKGVWLVRVYLGTDPNTVGASLPGPEPEHGQKSRGTWQGVVRSIARDRFSLASLWV